jgi:anti-sigma regulatory factor (Ser/Thr protein kinase)
MVRGLSLSLPPLPTASRVARAAVRDHFADALSRNTVSDLELVVPELVTNAVEHGHGTVQACHRAQRIARLCRSSPRGRSTAGVR